MVTFSQINHMINAENSSQTVEATGYNNRSGNGNGEIPI